MFLPTSYSAALLLLILSLVCLGSWANTFKLAGKWRFELYYFDFAFGLMLCAVAAALTLGSFGGQDYPLSESFALIPQRRNMAFAFGAGVVFNLGNMLLVASIPLAGLSVSFPIASGFALTIALIWNYARDPRGNPMLLFSGVFLLLTAVIAAIVTHWFQSEAKAEAAIAHASRNVQPGKRPPSLKRSGGSIRGIVLALGGGLFMALSYPLYENSKDAFGYFTPYAMLLLYAGGMFVASLILTFFFMLAPLHGEPPEIADYFRGTKKAHLLGLGGGVLFFLGTLFASLAAKSAEVSASLTFGVPQAALLLAVFWGFWVWREADTAPPRAKATLVLSVFLYTIGVIMASIAGLHT